MRIIALLPLLIVISCGEDFKDATMPDNPFRMGKLNTLWQKAMRQLSNDKLVKLHSELKVQDTEELTFKKLKAAGGDKDGMKEAALRKKMLGIAIRYSLSNENIDAAKFDKRKLEKIEFKDKKLNKLWLKAEQSGLTQLELKALMEEFQHHQGKIDEYQMLITKVGGSRDVNEVVNEIHGDFDQASDGYDNNYNENLNIIRNKHKELKVNYNSLVEKANLSNDDFSEGQAATLWQMALRSDFNDAELESLKEELKHFEIRLQKLNHMENHMTKISVDKYEDMSEDDKEKILSSSDLEGQKILQDRLNKQKRYVQKMQDTFEQKIIARHLEL